MSFVSLILIFFFTVPCLRLFILRLFAKEPRKWSVSCFIISTLVLLLLYIYLFSNSIPVWSILFSNTVQLSGILPLLLHPLLLNPFNFLLLVFLLQLSPISLSTPHHRLKTKILLTFKLKSGLCHSFDSPLHLHSPSSVSLRLRNPNSSTLLSFVELLLSSIPSF